MKRITLTELARRLRQAMLEVAAGFSVAVTRAKRGRVKPGEERGEETVAVIMPYTAYRVTLQALHNIEEDPFDVAMVMREVATALDFIDDEGDGDD